MIINKIILYIFDNIVKIYLFNQLDTNPAGIELVMVWRGWKPNYSEGIPNCTNFA